MTSSYLPHRANKTTAHHLPHPKRKHSVSLAILANEIKWSFFLCHVTIWYEKQIARVVCGGDRWKQRQFLKDTPQLRTPFVGFKRLKKKNKKGNFPFFFFQRVPNDRHARVDCLIPLVSFTPIMCTETKVIVTRSKNVPVTENAVILSYNGSSKFLSYAPNLRNQPNPIVVRQHARWFAFGILAFKPTASLIKFTASLP